MKKFLYLLLPAILFATCQVPLENVNDYFPVCRIDSTSTEFGGSITVYGTIVSPGASAVVYKGFSLSTSPNPNLEDNQSLITSSSTTFKHSYFGLNPNSTYYIRPWADNYYGYSQGEEVVINGIPEPEITSDCDPLNNYIQLQVIPQYPINYTYNPYTNVQLYDNCLKVGSTFNLPVINFNFSRLPTTGIYTTCDGYNIGPTQVYVNWSYPTLSSTQKLDSNQTIYVKKNSNNSFDIKVCYATYKYNNTEYHMYIKAHLN